MSLVAMEGMNVFKHPPKPTVLVTTTTGSGSEVSPVFIITDPERMVKMNIGGRGAQASVSILDPAMLKSLNADIVLATGMDAITQLYKRLRLLTRLPDEIDSGQFEDWADRTMENPLFTTTVKKPSKPEIIELYHRAKAEWSYR